MGAASRRKKNTDPPVVVLKDWTTQIASGEVLTLRRRQPIAASSMVRARRMGMSLW